MSCFNNRNEQADRVLRLFGNGKKYFGYCIALVGNRDDAEDLLQDCVIKAVTAINQLKDEQAFEAWFYKLIRNAFIDSGRKKKLLPQCSFGILESSSLEDILNRNNPADRADDTVLRKINGEAVWNAIEMLSMEHAEVVVLHYIMEYSIPEIVSIAGEADGTIRSRVSRAISKLRDILLPMIMEVDE